MKKRISKASAAGLSAGSFKVSMHFNEHQILNSHRGHGFAAEKLNNTIDKTLGREAKIVGVNNLKKGPDRVVDGVYLQTKYCQTAQESVSALFENGQYAYFNPDGSPMVAEVPRDQYAEALKEMKRRISKGQMPGVDDPEKAHELIKKGHVTYRQAANMARAGTIESLTYDAVTGVVVSGYALGVSALVTYAHAKWSGKSHKEALEQSLKSGVQVFGVTLLTHIGVQQLSRTAVNTSLERGTNAVAASLPRGARNALARAINPSVMPNSIASINTVSKALRSNILSSVVTTTILSAKDLYHFSHNEISGLQCFKNICTTGASVVGGGLGFWAGAAIGAPFGPLGVYGLGLVGSFIAGSVSSTGAKQVVDLLGEDDGEILKTIIEEQFFRCLDDYLVTNEELTQISQKVHKMDWVKLIRRIYSSSSREQLCYKIFEAIVLKVLQQRSPIKV